MHPHFSPLRHRARRLGQPQRIQRERHEGGAHVTLNTRGEAGVTLGAPGTGLYWTEKRRLSGRAGAAVFSGVMWFAVIAIVALLAHLNPTSEEVQTAQAAQSSLASGLSSTSFLCPGLTSWVFLARRAERWRGRRLRRRWPSLAGLWHHRASARTWGRYVEDAVGIDPPQ